jgi:hypothetical protein
MQNYNDAFDVEWEVFRGELMLGSERACAIVGGAFLDEQLLRLLRKYLGEFAYKQQLLDPNRDYALLGDFSAKNTMACVTS